MRVFTFIIALSILIGLIRPDGVWSLLGCVLLAHVVGTIFRDRAADKKVEAPPPKRLSDDEYDDLHAEISELKDTVQLLKRQRIEALKQAVTAYDLGLKAGNTGNISPATGTTFRNVMLQHHNARQTDDSYKESRLYKQTEDCIKSLNTFLEKHK